MIFWNSLSLAVLFAPNFHAIERAYRIYLQRLDETPKTSAKVHALPGP